MLKENIAIKDFVYGYKSQEARVYNFKYNPINQTLLLEFENIEYLDETSEEIIFIKLDVTFSKVVNLNVAPQKPLETIDEYISGIKLDGENTVSIITDEHDFKTNKSSSSVIKFVAESVTLIESRAKLKNLDEYYDKYAKKPE